MHDHQAPGRPSTLKRLNTIVAWLLGPVFIVIAVGLTLAPARYDLPVGNPPVVKANLLQVKPLRKPLGDPPMAVVNGFKRDCMDCHRLFKTTKPQSWGLTQHGDIKMRHGINDRCLNCHDADNRNMLVLHDGSTIPFTQTPLLCAKCHGTAWRDWRRGMHGKTLGSWNESSGKQRRLTCTECHNPHSPAFDPIKPLPAPITMRMGDQHPVDASHEPHNPLRIWSEHSYEPPHDDHQTSQSEETQP